MNEFLVINELFDLLDGKNTRMDIERALLRVVKHVFADPLVDEAYIHDLIDKLIQEHVLSKEPDNGDVLALNISGDNQVVRAITRLRLIYNGSRNFEDFKQDILNGPLNLHFLDVGEIQQAYYHLSMSRCNCVI